MKKKNKLIKCPACGKNTFKLECRYHNYLYKRCRSCGAVIFANAPSTKELNKLYSQDLAKGDDKERNLLLYYLMNAPLGAQLFNILRHWNYESRARSVKNLLPRGGEILDIGCGTGEFLSYMGNSNWKLFGAEVSNHLVTIARKKTKAHIYNLGVPLHLRQKFDVVTLWHVFEHLPHPEKAILNISSLVKKDGYLVIEVPHANSSTFNLFKDKWTLLLVPQHLHFWSQNSFEALITKKQLRIEKIEYPPHFPFVFVSSIVKARPIFVLLAPLLLPLSFFLALLNSYVRKGEVIRVYLRKRS